MTELMPEKLRKNKENIQSTFQVKKVGIRIHKLYLFQKFALLYTILIDTTRLKLTLNRKVGVY